MSHHDVSDAGKDNPRTPKEVIGVHKIADAAHIIPGTVVKHVHAVIEAQAIGDAERRLKRTRFLSRHLKLAFLRLWPICTPRFIPLWSPTISAIGS
jgi:hypothetical protein